MLKYHSISQTTYDRAVAQPIHLVIHNQANDCIASRYPYFCDYVKHIFEHTPGLGLTLLRRGGLTITTTLRPKIQKAAENGIHQYVHAREPNKVASAEAVVQPGTGEVKAIAVSTKYGNNPKKQQNSIDYAVDTKYGGSRYGFHAGSTFKLFVLTAALKEGIPLSTTIKAPSTITVNGYTNCAGQSAGDYPLHNAGDSESGTFNLEDGTWFSVNTFYAQLEQRTGLCEPVKLAEEMGMQPVDGGPIPQVPSFVLGSAAGFSPLDLAGAYATMAAHGKYCSPIAITSIVDRSGHSYPVPKSHCTQVVDPGLANTVTSILEGDLTMPGATATEDILSGRPAAAKTGTVDNYDGSWFAGYTPQLAAAVWAGIPAEPNKSLGGLKIGGVQYGEVFGATLAGRIWQSTMNAALKDDPVVQFTGPDNFYEIGMKTKVPDVTGAGPGDRGGNAEPGRLQPTDRAGHRTQHREGGYGRAHVATGRIAGVDRRRGQDLRQRRHPPSRRSTRPRRRPRHHRPHRHRRHRREHATGEPDDHAGHTAVRSPPPPPPHELVASDNPARGAGGSRPASWRRTSAAIRPPSARPATCGCTTFMTWPIACGPSAPVEAMAAATIAPSSSSPIWAGR